MNQPTEKEILLASDVRELTDAIRTAWQAHEAWRTSRYQAVRLLDLMIARHTRNVLGPELGLAPLLLDSTATSQLDGGSLQYLIRAIERKRAMDAEVPHLKLS